MTTSLNQPRSAPTTGTPLNEVPALASDVTITAPASRVWAMVSDVTRMPEWSPQVTSSRLRDGFDRCALGTQFTNRNIHGELAWITHGEIVRYQPEREIAFRIEENWVVWSFQLEPLGDLTRLTQQRETPDGISDLSKKLTDDFMGGQEPFTVAMSEGMRATLDAIKRAAEA